MRTKITLEQLKLLHDNNFNIKVNTPYGYNDITDVYEKYSTGYRIKYSDNTHLDMAESHLSLVNNDWIPANMLKIGDNHESKYIVEKNDLDYNKWIDFSVDHESEEYICNDIIHHNSGKSLNIYATVRWYTSNRDKKVLIIVPTVTLVTQLYSDFNDYSNKVGNWNSADKVHTISAGAEKDTDKQIIISTWQSIFRQPKSWFNQFGMIYCDEVHGAKAVSIKNIMENTTNCEFKIGTTGTTGSKKVNDLLIEGVFGKIKKVISTKELMNRNQVAKLSIKCVLLQYKEVDRKECRNKNYQEEVDYLVNHTQRNRQIVESLADMDGVHLLLANKVAHVKILHKMISEYYPNRKVYIIHGKTKKEEREHIRKQVDKEDNATVIATYGTLSTGVSIRNINHVIFASGSKSEIRVLQSLGRGLRLSEIKNSVVLWDIVDDLSIKKKKNFLLKHFLERHAIYTKEQFDIEMVKVEL